MKIAALILAALPLVASAQDCAPKTWLTPNATGSPMVEVFTSDAAAAWWWCPIPAPTGSLPGATYWKQNGYRGLLSGWTKLPGAAWRITTAADPWAQYQIERDANALTAPSGSEACSLAKVEHAACVALMTAPLGAGYPAPVSRDEAMRQCGMVPTCPGPVMAWRTPASSKSGALSVYSVVNGKRSNTPIPGRSAPFNAACDCGLFRQDITAAGVVSTYCALAGGPATECTLCRQVAQ